MRPGEDPGADGAPEQATRKQRRQRAREERHAREAALRRAAVARRRHRLLAAGATALVVVVVAAVALVATRGGRAPAAPLPGEQATLLPLGSLGVLLPAPAPGPLGPERVPVPEAPVAATTAADAGGEPVDGIECSTAEQTLFHIHAHLTLLVNGRPRQVPYGIGIPGARAESTPFGPFVSSGDCFYWLHTHAGDGIIHVESPVQRTYTLGDFFDIWGQPLSPVQVASARGVVTALYDGARYEGDPRSIPLTAHAQIQLDVGRPLVAPTTIEFPPGL